MRVEVQPRLLSRSTVRSSRGAVCLEHAPDWESADPDGARVPCCKARSVPKVSAFEGVACGVGESVVDEALGGVVGVHVFAVYVEVVEGIFDGELYAGREGLVFFKEGEGGGRGN